MNTHHIHTKLSNSIRRLAKIQRGLACADCSLMGRIIGQIRQAYFKSHIARLTYQLRPNY